MDYFIAEVGDAENIIKLVNSSYRGPQNVGWTHELDLLDGTRLDTQLYIDMLTDDGKILVFGDRNEPSACVYIQRQDSEVYIGMLSVLPTLQGKGLGRFVLSIAEKVANEEWGCTKAVMSVISIRSELIEYYFRRGYIDSGEKEPFPYGNEHFGIPKRDDLTFSILVKDLQ